MIPQPQTQLWSVVKGFYDSWPPDNEDIAQELGTALKSFAKVAADGSQKLINNAGTLRTTWRDEAGGVLAGKIGTNATQWTTVNNDAALLAEIADSYANVIITAKRFIIEVIARNDEWFLQLLAEPEQGTTKAIAFAKDVADYLREMVDGTPAHSSGGCLVDKLKAGVENVAGELVNGLASLGNAMVQHPGDTALAAGGLALAGLGMGGEVGGSALDLSVAGAPAGIAINVGSAGVIAGGLAMAGPAIGDLTVHANTDDGVQPMRTDNTASGDDSESTEGFRGSEYTKDEYVEFANGHGDDGNPAMAGGPRPTRPEIKAALDRAQPVKPVNQQNPNSRQEQFDYKGVRVIVNYDMPWRTTTYYTGRK